MDNGIPRPNFFIAGAPKCGTSSMHDYLHQHPECYMSEEMKEPGFFNPDLRINTVRRAATEERYLSLFRKGVGKRRIGESSTWYMYSKVAAKMIAELGALDPDHLGVIARTTTMLYKAARKDIGQITQEHRLTKAPDIEHTTVVIGKV